MTNRLCARHRGSTLVELLVALPLAMLAAACAAMLIVRVSRTARGQSAILSTTRELRHARELLIADLAPLDGRDLSIVSDTLLEIQSHLGVVLVCDGRNASQLIVSVPVGTSVQWIAGVRNGDDVRAWQESRTIGDSPREQRIPVVTPPTPVASAPCHMNDTTVVQRWRLSFADTSIRLLTGSPMLIRRGTRFQHYRSNGVWWLGRRQRDGVSWDGLQPAVGPLLSPAHNGVRFRALSAAGTAVAVSASLPDSVASTIAGIEVAFRAPRRAYEHGARGADSGAVTIALRASAFARGRP